MEYIADDSFDEYIGGLHRLKHGESVEIDHALAQL